MENSPPSSVNAVPLEKFKVVLLGEGCVGKTSLVLRYVENKFNPRHVTTLQASFFTKRLNLAGSKRVELSIWDTAGQERFHALGPVYYRGSHGALLVYDVTDEDSFEKVKTWVRELRTILGERVQLVVAGNKSDLLDKDPQQRRVDAAKAEEYCRTVGAVHFETSAKLNRNIEEMFLTLTQNMCRIYSGDPTTSKRASTRGGLTVEADGPSGDGLGQKEGRKCC